MPRRFVERVTHQKRECNKRAEPHHVANERVEEPRLVPEIPELPEESSETEKDALERFDAVLPRGVSIEPHDQHRERAVNHGGRSVRNELCFVKGHRFLSSTTYR